MNSERIVSLAQRTAFRDPENNYKENTEMNTEIKNTVCQGDYPPDTSLYLHIPFCIRKCSYCDFLSSPQDEGTREEYVQALIREILVQGDCFSGTKVDTIFFGGGTPSILTEKQISRIMEAVHASFSVRPDAEISLEMNPGTAEPDKLRAFRQAGINRLSIGVQSLHDDELRLLGRIHTAAQAETAFLQAREAGFENINIDLISALPGQTPEKWEYNLSKAINWKPEHISAYSLIIEPGTAFAEMQEKGQLLPVPGEEDDRTIYHTTGKILSRAGYRQYEISNYALPGKECRHNIGYWTGHEYLGLGIGAASYIRGCRFSNTPDLSFYLEALKKAADGSDLESIREEVHSLTDKEKMEEFMFLGLRMTDGTDAGEFERRFGRSLESVYGDVIRRHIRQGVAEHTQKGIRLTARGIDVSNYVLADYLL